MSVRKTSLKGGGVVWELATRKLYPPVGVTDVLRVRNSFKVRPHDLNHLTPSEKAASTAVESLLAPPCQAEPFNQRKKSGLRAPTQPICPFTEANKPIKIYESSY